MQSDKAIEAIRQRVRDPEQEKRIKELGERIEDAFVHQQAQGVKDALRRDWNALKRQFDITLKKLQDETGLY